MFVVVWVGVFLVVFWGLRVFWGFFGVGLGTVLLLFCLSGGFVLLCGGFYGGRVVFGFMIFRCVGKF